MKWDHFSATANCLCHIRGEWHRVMKVNTALLWVWRVFYHAVEGGFGWGEAEETLTLLTSLNYLHIPICHPDHLQGTWRTGLGKDEAGRGSTPRTWHSARESSMTRGEEKRKWPAGISQSERQKRSQLFILAGAKRAPEQVVQPGASGATEEGEKKERRKKKKKKTIKETHPRLMCGCSCVTFGLGAVFFPLPGTYCFAQHYYA